jgi:hypothetical protein
MTRGVFRPSANFSILKPAGNLSDRNSSVEKSRGAGFTTLLCELLWPGVFIA